MRTFTTSIRFRNRLLISVFGLAALTVLAAGCGGAAKEERAAPAPAPAAVKRCDSGYAELRSKRRALAAVVKRPTQAYRRPGGAPFARLATANVNDYPMVLGVLGGLRRGCETAWYRVQLPLRPNGVTGWVRAADVSLEPVPTRIVVDLSAHRLVLYRKSRPVLATTVGVGAPGTPTPTGRFYVNQRLIPSDPTGPYGPSAVGVSAFSDVLVDWAQGGPIGIHGTNEPWTIGRSVSNGCIRVRNAVMRRLFARAIAGTPVVIRQ